MPARSRLTRDMRLSGARNFKLLFRRGERSTDRWLTVLARANGADRPRLGFALSRKHVRTAVLRNRIKRAVRESFRREQAALGGLDIVVLARPGFDPRGAFPLDETLSRHWRRLRERIGPTAPPRPSSTTS